MSRRKQPRHPADQINEQLLIGNVGKINSWARAADVPGPVTE